MIRRISVLCLLCLIVLAGPGCRTGVPVVDYEALKALLENETVLEKTSIIDVRDEPAWDSGSIQNAINIELETLVDSSGSLLNGGEALTSVVTDRQRPLVVYGAGDGSAQAFAEQAAALGYRNVSYYRGGIADWTDQGDYLVMTYRGFKQWYDEYCPFDEGENVLVDLMDAAFYAGDGHVPGAINLWDQLLFTGDKGDEIVNSGQALTDAVADQDAKVVFYCYFAKCPKSMYASRAAVSLGYRNVFRYPGGWQEWTQEGNPVNIGDEPGTCEE